MGIMLRVYVDRERRKLSGEMAEADSAPQAECSGQPQTQS